MTLAAIVFGVAGHRPERRLRAGHLRPARRSPDPLAVGSPADRQARLLHVGSRKPDQYMIDAPDEIRARMSALPETDDVMQRLNFSGLITNGRSDLAIIGEGLEPAREARLGSYLVLAAGRQLTDKDRYGMLIGYGVARALKLAPGDRASLVLNTADGAMNTLEFEVVGVFQSFSKDYDARAVKIPLARRARSCSTRRASTRSLSSLKRTRDTDRVARSLAASLGGRAARGPALGRAERLLRQDRRALRSPVRRAAAHHPRDGPAERR